MCAALYMLYNAEKNRRFFYCYFLTPYDSLFRCLAEKLCKLNQSTLKNPPVRVDIFYYGNKSPAVDSNYRLMIKTRPSFSG